MEDREHSADFYVVGIGASAGGLEALEKFFSNMSSECGLAFVVIQHLSPDYKSLMADLLSKRTLMPVRVAQDGMAIAPNSVYLIPSKMNLTIFHRKLYLTERESEQLHLPIDIFFQSLAEDLREKAIGIILSGTGSDGTRGIRAIKEQGGMVMVQDERSAKFDGMPRSAIATNLVDYILAPEDMARDLINYTQHPCLVGDASVKRVLSRDDDSLSKIFALLRSHTGVDFTYYKQNTMLRRIERRMGIRQVDRLSDYLHYLYQSSAEVNVLYRELLIGVTRFFRDPEAFDLLRREIIPEIFEDKERSDQVRVWVAGCSTGEEAYSLAMLLMAHLEVTGRHLDVKVFATDLDKEALEYASHGEYPESIVADVALEYLQKYFVKRGDRYAVMRPVREMVIFAQQNLITDPPFSKVDLICCRNVLIYLQPVLQKKVIAAFQFALNPGGFLFLGTSETVGEARDLFDHRHRKWKIYQYKGGFRPPLGANRLIHLMSRPRTTASRYGTTRDEEGRRVVEGIYRGVIEAFLPPVIIVNESADLVHSFGDLDPYLRVPTGGAFSADVLKMAREGLAIPISTAIHKVLKDHQTVIYNKVSLGGAETVKTINLIAKPFVEPGSRQKLVLIQFEPVKSMEFAPNSVEAFDLDSNAQQRIMDLEHELQYTRESLQATVEELETSNEELQATNEELLAANEELQSTNEELQSVNEELITVNTEYHAKIQELTDLNADMNNLLESTDVGTIFLDRDLCIRRFTPAVQDVIPLLDQDIGRPLSHISHTIEGCDLMSEARAILKTLASKELEVHNRRGDWYRLKLMPYYTLSQSIGGVVITLVDVTALKAANNRLRKLSAAVEQSLQLKILIDLDGKIEYANPKVMEVTGYTAEDLIGLPWDRVLVNKTEAAKVEQRLDQPVSQIWQDSWLAREALRSHETWSGELLYKKKHGGAFWCAVTVSPVHDADGNFIGALNVAEDITERKAAQARLLWELDVNAALSALYKPLISPDSSLEDIANTVLTYARRLTGSDHGYVSFVDPLSGDNISYTLTEMLKGGACHMSDDDQRITFPREDDGRYPSLWGYALNTREAFYTEVPEAHPASRGLPEGHIALRRFLSVPVMLGDQLVGQIALANAEEGYTARDLDAVQRLAEFYALAVQRRRIEDALRESEARYSSLFDNEHTVMLLINPESGCIVDANRAAETYYGYAKETLLAKHIQEINTLSGPQIIAEMRQARREEKQRFEFQHRLSNGETRHVEVYSGPITVNGMVSLYSIVHDITARKHAQMLLQQERDFTAAVLDTIGALIIVLDPQGHIVRFNKACEHLTGYTFTEVEDRPFWDLFILPEELEAVKTVFKALRAGQFPNHHKNYWLTREGESRLIAWSNTAILAEDTAAQSATAGQSSGEVAYVVGTGIEVT